MAFITMITCTKCHKEKQVTCGSGQTKTVCNRCAAKEADRKRREHFGSLDGLTIEERLRKLEEWVYNYRPYKEPRF
jgi:hypothetical protein